MSHPLDAALLAAWSRIRPKLLADVTELRARLARRHLPDLTRPPRARCIAIRANDRRITILNTEM